MDGKLVEKLVLEQVVSRVAVKALMMVDAMVY